MKYLLLFVYCTFAQAAFEVPGFELVYTTPAETSLQNPDLRGPAEVWVDMISSAKKTIDFEEMYAVSKPGEALEVVIEAMEAAANRGVKIRFLLEEKMLRASSAETITRLEKIKNLELRILSFGKLGTGGILHAKFFVVDGKTAYVGSQNFDWRSLKHIHETGLRTTDTKISSQLQEVFHHDWKAWELVEKGAKAPPLRVKPLVSDGKERAYLVASPNALDPKGVIDSESELVRLLGEAKSEIRVQLLDYCPLQYDHSYYGVIDNALRAAASRGVKVKLMVSHWNQSKPGIDYLKSLALIPNVAVEIVTIPMAREGKIPFARVNHSKFLVIDNRIAWVGTSNWTGGYLDKLRNVEIVVRDEKLAQRLGLLHDQLWESPYGATLDILKDYPPPNKGE